MTITIMNNKRCNIGLSFDINEILFGLEITNFDSVISIPIVFIHVGIGFISLYMSINMAKSETETDERRLCPAQPTVPPMPKERYRND